MSVLRCIQPHSQGPFSTSRKFEGEKGPWERGFDAYSFFSLKMICIILSLKINYFLHRFVLFSMFKIYSSTDIFELRL